MEHWRQAVTLVPPSVELTTRCKLQSMSASLRYYNASDNVRPFLSLNFLELKRDHKSSQLLNVHEIFYPTFLCSSRRAVGLIQALAL